MEYNVNEISMSEKEIEITLKYDEIKSDIDEEIKKQSKASGSGLQKRKSSSGYG